MTGSIVTNGTRRWVRRIGWSLFVLLLAMTVALVAVQPYLFALPYRGPVGDEQRDALVRRDVWGVPHILAGTEADGAYALAYANAEDDFATIQQALMVTRGRAGEVGGAKGAAADYAFALLDVRSNVERRYLSDVSPSARAIAEAYAQGLNRYALDHPDEVIARGLFPAQGKDIVAGLSFAAPFLFGLDNVLDALATGKPLPREGGPLTDSGSNGFAVSPRRSSDGSTWFVSNSHQPWDGAEAWWEAHVTTRDGLDFSGAALPGLPLPFQGHNRDIAFMTTRNRPDLIDVYRLTLDDAGTHYRLDGRWVPLEQHRIWLHVRFGPVVLPVPKTIYRSAQGPVVINKQGAFAIRYAGMGDLHWLDQQRRMIRARNYAEWSGAAAMAAVPAMNFVYADRDGHIAAIYNGAFPRRTPGYDWRGVLPGDDSKAIWHGYVPWSLLPRTVDPRSGYVFSSNNAPWLASGPGDGPRRADFPAWLGVEDDLTNRALRASALFEASPRIDEAALRRIKYDKTVDRRSILGRYVAAVLALDVRRDPDLARGQALLRQWDFAFDGRTVADSLAEELLRAVNRRWYARLPLAPPAQGLRTAMAYLTDHFGRIDPPFDQVMRIRRGDQSWPATGGPDVLRALASWGEPGETPRLVFGDSYILWVRWGPDGRLTARSVVPYGSAVGRPGSRHYADQTPLFVREALKPAWFDEAELAPHIVCSYRPIERLRIRC
jgi:acyl-homoserine-lactone acylase